MSSGSAPFPVSSDPVTVVSGGESTEARWVVAGEKRRGVLPSFYEPHRDLSLVVKNYDGIPLKSEAGRTFTIGEVLLERRWAVDAEGKCLRQDIFKNLMMRMYEETYKLAARDGGPDNKAQIPPLEYESYPAVEAWVAKMADPNEPYRTVPMHYEPHPKDVKPPDHFYDSDGEVVKGSRLEHLVEAYRSPTLRSTLQPREIAEVEAYLGGSQETRESELEAKIAELEKKLDAVLVKPAPEPPAPTEAKATATCGREFTASSEARAQAAVRMHKKHCRLGCNTPVLPPLEE